MGDKKSVKSVNIVKRIATILKTPEVFGVIKYQEKNEDYIKAQMYPHLLREVAKIYEDVGGFKPDTCMKKAKENLLWEGNVHTIVNNVTLFGVWHRPDMILDYADNMRVAIEIKRGDAGKDIRDGVGQAVFYAQHFNFVILLHVDTGREKNILNAMNGVREQNLIKSLWDIHNIHLDVV